MQKIIVDTNILVSSLIQRSYPYLVIEEIFKGSNVQLCVSEKLMLEYYAVLSRDKFSKYPDFVLRAEALLIDIERKAALFNPKLTLTVIADFADNRLLELAVESHADYIITGNTNDFTFSEYEGTKIISPKEYWDLLK